MSYLKCSVCGGVEIWIDEMEQPGPKLVYGRAHCMKDDCGHAFDFNIMQDGGGVEILGLVED